MGTTANKLSYLLTTKENIRDAIIEKGIPISDGDTFREYAEKISEISLGIDTSDATATENDLIVGKTAYAKEQKITGNIPVFSSVDKTASSGFVSGNNYKVKAPDGYYNNSYVLRPNSSVAGDIGLTSDKLVEGNTILDIVGKAKSKNYTIKNGTASMASGSSGTTITFDSKVIAIFYRFQHTTSDYYGIGYYVNPSSEFFDGYDNLFDNTYPNSVPTSIFGYGQIRYYASKVSDYAVKFSSSNSQVATLHYVAILEA